MDSEDLMAVFDERISLYDLLKRKRREAAQTGNIYLKFRDMTRWQVDITLTDMDNNQIILYQTQGGESKIEVWLVNETVWLTADQMTELFHRNKSTFKGVLWMSLRAMNCNVIQLLQKMRQLLMTAG